MLWEEKIAIIKHFFCFVQNNNIKLNLLHEIHITKTISWNNSPSKISKNSSIFSWLFVTNSAHLCIGGSFSEHILCWAAGDLKELSSWIAPCW